MTFTTRDGISASQGSLIDLLFTNRPDLFSNVVVYHGLGNNDHNGVKFHLSLSYDHKTVSRSFYQCKKADIGIPCDTICRIPWDTYFSADDINEVWVRFQDFLFAAAKDVVNGQTKWKKDASLDFR